MGLDNRRLPAALVAALATCLCACQPQAGGDSDSVPSTPPTRSDTASAQPRSPATSTDTATVRADSIVLRTDKSAYTAGERVTLTVENKSASTYAFNPCTRSLEREQNGSWTNVPEEGRICTMEAWILEPRESRTGTTELPIPLPPGRYRVVLRLTKEQPGSPGAAVAAVSEPIEIDR
jgi:hypothetical protein